MNVKELEKIRIEIINKILTTKYADKIKLQKYLDCVIKQIPKKTNFYEVLSEIIIDFKTCSGDFNNLINQYVEELENLEHDYIEYIDNINLVRREIKNTMNIEAIDNRLQAYIDSY